MSIHNEDAVSSQYVGSKAQNVPELDSNAYSFDLNQNEVAGTVVFSVSCTYSGQLQYEIVIFTPNIVFLSIDSANGNLTLLMDAFGLEVGDYTVSLRCVDPTDPTKSDLSLLTVSRVDENEFLPIFVNSDPLQVSISESRDFTSDPTVADIDATDSDLGTFGSITYTVQGTTPDPFSLNSNTGVVTLVSSLDREAIEIYQFIVAAVNPPDDGIVRSAEILVIIEVTNVNDQPPEFTESNYQVMVHETAVSKGFPRPSPGFYTVQCTDTDTPQTNIRYAISLDGDPGPFTLDATSGDLSVTEDLDYETRTSYSFSVTCSDNGSPNFTASAIVDVTVTSVNEFDPVVDSEGDRFITIGEDLAVGSVLVSSEPGSLFVGFAVSDADAGPDGNITYTLSEDTSFFSVDLLTGSLVLEEEIDLDGGSMSFITLTIVACDTFPPRDICPNLRKFIFLTQVDDDFPTFSQENYIISVPENIPIGSLLLEAMCVDEDVGPGAFSGIDFVNITQDINETFSVDTLTGNITTLTELDSDTIQSYEFTLQCTDTAGNEGYATVQVSVFGVNDNIPVFQYPQYQFEVSRTTPANRYPVGTVAATDADIGAGGDLEYTIEPNDYFDITSDGVIELYGSVLDYPAQNISLTLQVSDGLFSTSSELIIILTDGNLNQPEFTIGSRAVELSELTPVGTNVISVLCSDVDTGPNGEILYFITTGNADNVFAINSTSGAISVANPLVLPQGISEEEYSLNIQCQDTGIPMLSDDIIIFIRVYQDDSNPPDIANDTITAFIQEDANINDVVVVVEAVDLDSDNLRFRFENESVPGSFIIDPSSGTVTVAAGLDRETINMYEMMVVVTEVESTIGPERSDTATLLIFIRDVNDNIPTCDTTLLTVTISETLSPGSSILQLNCADPDFDENGQISYSLSEDFGVLSISSEGDIALQNPLNQTGFNTLVVSVTVSDLGFPSRTNTYQITIFVSAANRNVPVFTNLPTTIDLSEATQIQEVVFTVQATDPDRGSFGQITYQIIDNGTSTPFEIFSNTGGIFLTQKLDFSEEVEYRLYISASDSDHTVIEELTVRVLDVNEYIPQCESTYLTTSIPEGLAPNQTLSAQLSCQDEDQGSNGEVIFLIVSGNVDNTFQVLPTGSILVIQALDFEAVQMHVLQIQVSDSGSPQFHINTTVVVTVQAINEFTPQFEEAIYRYIIPENISISTNVLQVLATDGDHSGYPDGQVAYSILASQEPVFSINNAGIIQVAGNLDRERRDYYGLTVQATDLGQPARTTTTFILINITDVDDNSPEFSQVLYITTLNHIPGNSTPVITVTCTDQDLGANALIAYSLDTSSNDSQYFEVSDSGMIQTRGNLPLSRTYTFTAVCTGPSPLFNSDTAIVSIQVLVQSNITFYPSSTYNATIPEDTTPVYNILSINATSTSDATLTYHLLTHDSIFTIDEITGTLWLITSLDYESITSYAVQVQASDDGEPPNIGDALVQIIVQNINDQSPQITTQPSSITLNETASTTTIRTYECVDRDDGVFGQVVFYIESGNEEGVFSISQSGVLQLIGNLDYESVQTYSLQITCEDLDDTPRSDSITVPITVLPMNDNSPVFMGDFVTISVTEALPVNSEVGPPVQATDADLPPHNDLRYTILFGNSDQMFAISPTTGQLTLVQSLDYEDTKEIILVVQVDDSGGQAFPDFIVRVAMVTVIVNIQDANDNIPQFPQYIYTGEIEETAVVSNQVLLDVPIECSDVDSQVNNQTSLYIIDIDSPFTIHLTTGIVTVQAEITERMYFLTLECRDSGLPQLTSEATLIISVLEINEFGPQFNSSVYRFLINETTPVGAEIGEILATDLDIGEHGAISYEFTNATGLLFDVGSSTGIVTLLTLLDYEAQERLFVLEAVANDSAGLTDFATVIIEVLNDDDNFPIFSQSNYFATIAENADIGALIGQVSCSDADDEADGSAVSYAFAMTSVPFQITDGRITVAGDLDLEVTPRYILGIICSDSAGNSLTASITIDLEPFNDFTPVFTGDVPYSTELVENPPTGLNIFQVTATDNDTVKYDDISFSIISGNGEGRFEIDPTTGIVTVNKSIDREVVSTYVLGVQAQNVIPADDTSGSPALSVTTTLTITILDINDNVPTILPSEVTAFLPDGSNGTVAQFLCTDPDLAENGTTSFSITSETTAGNFALIDNGTLIVTDFMSTDVVIEVTCSDTGTPSRSTTALVIIRATSMNDHTPIFPQAAYTVDVLESQVVGMDIQCFTATDMDGSDTLDGTLKYSLEPQSLGSDTLSRFSIREDSGCVFVSITLDATISDSYQYTVVATDGGEPPLSGTTTVVISVLDIIRDPPVFQGAPYTRILSEGVESGTFIASAICTDPDGGDVISYRIISGNNDGIFSVDNATGVIVIASGQRLDYEVSISHVLVVECVDLYGLSDSANVFVTVTPINEFTPSFQSVNVTVPEHSIAGSTLVTQLEWSDADNGPDGEITFNITSGNSDGDFIITNDGRILVSGVLDREVIDYYILEIEISDLAESIDERRSTINHVGVTITDINDNVPVFDSNPYELGPLEGNEPIGYYVGTVYCSDGDLELNGEVTYRLMGGTSLFGIGPVSGDLTVAGDLETRDTDNIAVFVECVDQGSLPLTGTTLVLVSVVEVNRNPPQFTNVSYYVAVLEDIDFSVILHTVVTTDTDAGASGQAQYFLQDDFDSLFSINKDTGNLSLLQALDFETMPLYQLVVEAIDGNENSPIRMTSTANITIEVLPVNEFEPVCPELQYNAIINETTVGEVISLGCSDDDSGADGDLVYYIISGNEDGLFSITNDGRIIVPVAISPDTNNEEFTLQILITDSGASPQQSQTEVVVIYSFEDLTSPTFNESEYFFTIPELSEVGSIVSTFVANDPDPSLQGLLTYRVNGTENFRINPTNGQLYIYSHLDFEAMPSEQFTIIAQDSDPNSPQSGSTNVLVTLLNENDTTPQCGLKLYTMNILSTAQFNDDVLTLGCEDGDGSVLRFQLDTDNRKRQTSSPFAVDETTGRVYVAAPLTPSTTEIENVVISDSSGETIEIVLTVQVMFANAEPPLFTQGVYNFSITEDAPLLSVIGSVLASDGDSSASDLTYSIVDPEQFPDFYMDPTTGELLLTKPLDYENRVQYSFLVQVQDGGGFDGSNKLTDTATVIVNVVNVNDNPPRLGDGGIYGTTIDINTAVGSAILRFGCTDGDAAPFGTPNVSDSSFTDTPFQLIHNSDSGSGGGILGSGSILGSGGSGITPTVDEYVVQVAGLLSEGTSYQIPIICTDEAGQSTEGQVLIFIPDSDAPEFSQPVYEWIISESAPTGSEFTEIGATGSNITFAIAEGNNDGTFFIDRTTGFVSLVGSLDYETQQAHGLIVTVTDGENQQSSILLVVQVLDENDQAPLTPPSAQIEVIQNTPIGYPIGTLQCTDGDANSMLDFTLTTPSGLFSVDEYGIVRLQGVLDTTPVHILPITCYDTTTPQSSSSGRVTIEITYINQYPPLFQLDSYAFGISEDIDVLPSLIGTVEASDKDIGSFGELTYSITEGNSGNFYVEPETGTIGILSPLDYESVRQYVLTVVAIDGGVSAQESSRRTGTTMVTILIQDANDNIPMHNQSSYSATIATNHTLFTPVVSVSCTDIDSSDRVSYSLYPPTEHFAVQRSGTILLTRQPSGPAFHNFSAICTDSGDPTLSSSALVTVLVNTVDLPVPVFNSTRYSVNISEDYPVFSVILRVYATPPDSTIDIIYSIENGNKGNYFHIDPATGDIFLISPLDANLEQLYTLTAKASDSRRAALFAFAVVSIDVSPINSNPPVFSRPFYLSSVSENAQMSTPVVQVQCTDPDVNTVITYEITDPLFNVTQEGLITVAGEIDYETETVHTLQVTCSDDGGDTPMSAGAAIRIEVLPVNEFLPTFLEPVYQFSVPENSFGVFLGAVRAEDQDVGSQGEITYHLVDPGDFTAAIIEPSTGELIANNLDYEAQTSWNLTVIARDGAGAESHITVEIIVSNINDAIPVISPVTALITLPHDSPNGLPLQTYTCEDEDGSDTSIFILDGNEQGYFSLNEFNQLVWMGNVQQLSSDSVFSLTIQCEDSSAPDQTSEAHTIITLEGIVSVAPQFSEDLYNTSIPEDVETGSFILTVFAYSDGSTIEYDIPNTPVDFPFSINETTGLVYSNAQLNHEMTPVYVFSVRATDTVSGATGLVLVRVEIEDANDNHPMILPLTHSVILPENYPLTSIASFACTDNDLGSNGETSFQIVTGTMFNITTTGIVELLQPLDFETTESYNVTIICIDGGLPSLSATATLIVLVTGVNEYAPQFDNSMYNFTIPETLAAGEIVGIVNATDDDAGVDGEIIYAIDFGTGIGFFSVNIEGELRTTTQSLNATEQSFLQVIVEATDSGSVIRNDLVLVSVSILDVNEPPAFAGSGSYLAMTNQTAETTIFEILCFDTDVGDNALLQIEIFSNPSSLNVFLDTEGSMGVIRASIVTNTTLEAGSYEVILRCSDSGTPSPMYVDATVTVRVEGVNTPPFFLPNNSVTISVREDTPTGTPLTTITAIDAESGLSYAITGGNGLGTFIIDSTTGEISLGLPLDYEITAAYTTTITAFDESPTDRLSTTTELNILVDNTNDLSPVLTPPGFQVITLSENTFPISDIRTYTCSDADGGAVYFSIDPPNGASSPFGITQVSSSGTIQLLGTVDYELQIVYSLTVTCTDEAIQSADATRQVSSVINIHITPENNFDPEFISLASFDVLEDTDIGEVVATVQATDQDNRGEITYSSSSHTNVFVIDQFSGNITLIQELDYEVTQEYILTIEASDNDIVQGVEPRTGTTMITIMVTDVNDNRPVCTSHVPTVQLETGMYDYIFLLQLSCSDADEGVNSLLNFSSDTPPLFPNGSFVINDTTGELGFIGTIATVGIILLDVSVSDSGMDPMSTRVTVTVQLLSGNISQPRFTPSEFNVTISENTPTQTTILNGSTLQGSLYNPLDAQVQYTLLPNPQYANTFVIDSINGDIILSSAQLLDFDEGFQEYLLVVEATVGEDTVTAIVHVYLTDFNDNAPQFEQILYEGSVAENQPNGTFVLQVRANDIDFGDNGVFLYSLEDLEEFSINTTTGEITTSRRLDYEDILSYSFLVLAVDTGIPEQTGSVVVTVSILDQNDVPPQFIRPVYTTTINDVSPPGAELIIFEVMDPDTVGSLEYVIITDDSRVMELFAVNSQDDTLIQRAAITSSNYSPRYNFTVQVNDSIAVDTTTVVIYVVSITSTSVLFEENTDGVTFDIRGFLLQQGFNITLSASYAIIAGNYDNEFIITSFGVLTPQQPLDRENTALYILAIRVSDFSTLEIVNLTITVSISDQNDNAPVFSNDAYTFSITEDLYALPTSIGTVNATDRDEAGTGNSRIEYSLIEPPSPFSIDLLTGEIFVLGMVDRETTDDYRFSVRASDLGGMVSYVEVVVTVTDINDNDPRFVPLDALEFLVIFTENTPAGTEPEQIVAILPGNALEVISAFEYTDPDITSEVTSNLQLVQGADKFKLKDIDDNKQVLVPTSILRGEDNGTVLQLSIMDEPVGLEDSSISAPITVIVSSTTIMTPTTPTNATAESPDASESGLSGTSIALIVVVVILFILLLLCCVAVFCFCCYTKRRKGTYYPGMWPL